MQFQLTLQFRGDSLGDYDAIAALKGELTEELGDSAEVDGHDVPLARPTFSFSLPTRQLRFSE